MPDNPGSSRDEQNQNDQAESRDDNDQELESLDAEVVEDLDVDSGEDVKGGQASGGGTPHRPCCVTFSCPDRL